MNEDEVVIRVRKKDNVRKKRKHRFTCKSREKADGAANCEAKLTVPRDIHVNSREIHVRMTCILGVLGAIVQPGLPKP